MTPKPAALVVDDDELVRNALVKQLKDLGLDPVLTAEDGAGGRRLLAGARGLSLVVCDVMMPNVDGVEFLREAARQQPTAAFILISSLEESVLRSVAVLARERGLRVLGALRKPVRADALKTLIARLDAAPAATSTARAEPRFNRADLERAVEWNQIGLQAQPKLRAGDGSLHSVELFARWTHPMRGGIGADEMFQAAERAGYTATLNDHLLALALRSCKDWNAQGQQAAVAINVRAATLARLDFPDQMARLLASLELPWGLVTLEVPESALADSVGALDVLTRLRMRGARVALDNFGAGQASVLRLQRLPINEIKIDRAFVRSLADSAAARAVIETAVSAAKALSLSCVATGVETAQQKEQVVSLGCDVLQGNALAPAMPVDAMLAWLQSRPAAHRK